MITRTVTVSFSVGMLLAACMAQKQADCPSRTVINNGVCVGKDGNNCLPEQLQSHICYSPEAQYTDEAAKALIKGTVRLTTTVGTDGCAHNIKVVSPLGYGLDEAAIAALERFRFRSPAKPVSIAVEINFDPNSSRASLAAQKCIREP